MLPAPADESIFDLCEVVVVIQAGIQRVDFWMPFPLPLANSNFRVGQPVHRRPQKLQIHPNREVRNITHKLKFFNCVRDDGTGVHRRLHRVHQYLNRIFCIFISFHSDLPYCKECAETVNTAAMVI